ncbi:MAG: hypothetical protein ACRDRG_13950 [Pseudonocardiaceae bacterium]
MVTKVQSSQFRAGEAREHAEVHIRPPDNSRHNPDHGSQPEYRRL